MKSIDVSIEEYSGPLDLLLDLINKNKINIYDIPINEITSEYLELLKKNQYRNIEIRVEFLYLAATLINIKTKMLLPSDNLDDDPRENLVEQLILYSKFKFQSSVLRQLFERNRLSFDRASERENFNVGVSYEIVGSVKRLNNSINRLLEEKYNSEEPVIDIVYKDRYNIEDISKNILNSILNLKKISFKNITKSKDKQFIITAFMALLELLNTGYLNFVQKENFDDIILVNKNE